MKKIHICGLVLLLLNMAQGFAQQEADFEWEAYDSDEPGVIITKYVGTDSDVIIPKEINGLPVTVVGENAFAYRQLTSVILPDSLIVIRDFAFSDNHLININIPSSVIAIYGDAFSGNRLIEVVIPDSVVTIRENAFFDNRITSITIPASVTEIGWQAFTANPVTSITIGENIPLNPVFPPGAIQRVGILGIDMSFEQAYISGGRCAGTYTRPDAESTKWTRQRGGLLR